VLLLGETGTGKELIARAIHIAAVARNGILSNSLRAIPTGLLESDLFGHERGASRAAIGAEDWPARVADEVRCS